MDAWFTRFENENTREPLLRVYKMDSETDRVSRAGRGAIFEPLKTTRYVADQCWSPVAGGSSQGGAGGRAAASRRPKGICGERWADLAVTNPQTVGRFASMRSRRCSRSKAATRCDAPFSLGASLSSNRPTLLTMAFIPAPDLPDSAGLQSESW
jgi:hypothetical protein